MTPNINSGKFLALRLHCWTDKNMMYKVISRPTEKHSAEIMCEVDKLTRANEKKKEKDYLIVEIH